MAMQTPCFTSCCLLCSKFNTDSLSNGGGGGAAAAAATGALGRKGGLGGAALVQHAHEVDAAGSGVAVPLAQARADLNDVEGATITSWQYLAASPQLLKGPEARQALKDWVDLLADAHPVDRLAGGPCLHSWSGRLVWLYAGRAAHAVLLAEPGTSWGSTYSPAGWGACAGTLYCLPPPCSPSTAAPAVLAARPQVPPGRGEAAGGAGRAVAGRPGRAREGSAAAATLPGHALQGGAGDAAGVWPLPTCWGPHPAELGCTEACWAGAAGTAAKSRTWFVMWVSLQW